MTFQKKANVTTEVVIGQAAVSLAKGLAELKSAVSTLETLQSKSDELQLQIVAKEEKVKELEVDYAEKQRAHQVKFDLNVRENSLKVIKEVLTEHQLVSVPEQELNDLRKGLETCQLEQDKRVKAEVAAAAGAISSNYEQKVKLLEAEYKAKEAGNLAKIENLTSQVTSLQHSVEEWKRQLDEERKASVERSKAGSIGTINLGNQEAGRR